MRQNMLVHCIQRGFHQKYCEQKNKFYVTKIHRHQICLRGAIEDNYKNWSPKHVYCQHEITKKIKNQLHFFRFRSEVNQSNAPKFVSSRGAYINNKK